MRRRDFLIGAGGVLGTWPRPAGAQPGARRPLVAVLLPVTEDMARRPLTAFRTRLAELGYVEGRDVDFAYRFAPADTADHIPEILALAPRIIVTTGVISVLSHLRQLPSAPPVVWAIMSQDPVALGFVQSYAHPGGNMTGIMLFPSPAIVGKQLSLLKELVPSIVRVDALLSATDAATARALPDAARNLGLEIETKTIARADQYAPAIAAAQGDAFFFGLGPMIMEERRTVLPLVAQKHRPAIYTTRDLVLSGGLVSYGADVARNYGRAGDYAAKILAGAKPADLPIEQPNNYELVVNLTTAKSLGIAIPPTLLARADEVIE